MIAKEVDPILNISQRVQSGMRAERDMAFYLRRAFGDHKPDVLVFNDIRLQHEGETAQIDHLIVHEHGMFVVESKSVGGEIQVLPDGQFIRHFGRGKQVGMLSPVLQAKRQADLLRRLLQVNKLELRDRKLLGLIQGGFAHCPMEIRVAISDHGIIRGDRYAPEVRKADLITGDIEERISAHRRSGSLLNLDSSTNDGMYRFTPTEMERLRAFLIARHTTRSCGEGSSEAVAEQASERGDRRTPAQCKHVEMPRAACSPELSGGAEAFAANAVQYLCSKCYSLSLQILYGRYGYYFKCEDCGGNTWIDTRIDGSERKGRIRKSGRDFFLVCPDTGAEKLLFTNPKPLH